MSGKTARNRLNEENDDILRYMPDGKNIDVYWQLKSIKGLLLNTREALWLCVEAIEELEKAKGQ